MKAVEVVSGDCPGSCVARYEALRGGALGQPVAPEHRSGLVVLLRRGMWTWARAVVGKPELMRAAGPYAPGAGPEPRALIHLLADLILAPAWRTS